MFEDEIFQWLKYALNPLLPKPEIKDWQNLYVFAEKQTVLGLCVPSGCGENRPARLLLLEWLGKVEIIKRRNDQLNKQTVILADKLKKKGIRCCILKGQGNAIMYPCPELRTPGDLDVWVDADRYALRDFVASFCPNEKESFKHIKFPVFKDTEVDLHFTPLKFYNPIFNKRLQKWLAQEREAQMSNVIKVPNTDRSVAIPTSVFNAIYQLGHILIHLEDEGIGLRQMVDYYYVLKQLSGLADVEKDKIVEVWRRLGLMRLAGAVLWVEHYMLGLPVEYMLVEPDEKKGRILADDILDGGNFGHNRKPLRKGSKVRFKKKWANVCHLIRLSMCFPGEALFRLFGKVSSIRKFCKSRENMCGIVAN